MDKTTLMAMLEAHASDNTVVISESPHYFLDQRKRVTASALDLPFTSEQAQRLGRTLNMPWLEAATGACFISTSYLHPVKIQRAKRLGVDARDLALNRWHVFLFVGDTATMARVGTSRDSQYSWAIFDKEVAHFTLTPGGKPDAIRDVIIEELAR